MSAWIAGLPTWLLVAACVAMIGAGVRIVQLAGRVEIRPPAGLTIAGRVAVMLAGDDARKRLQRIRARRQFQGR